MLRLTELNALLSDYVKGACHASDPWSGHRKASDIASEALAAIAGDEVAAAASSKLAVAWLRQVWEDQSDCVVDRSAQSCDVVNLLVREAKFSFDQAVGVILALSP